MSSSCVYMYVCAYIYDARIHTVIYDMYVCVFMYMYAHVRPCIYVYARIM
jgi:hypothetical protein